MKQMSFTLLALAFLACDQSAQKDPAPTPTGEPTATAAAIDSLAEPLPSLTSGAEKLARMSSNAEQAMAKQPVDPAWAPPHELAIGEVIAKLPATSLLGAECRSTLCRVRVVFDDPKAQSGLYHKFLDAAADRPITTRVAFASWVVHTDDKTSVLWITRPGCPTPGPGGVVGKCIEEPPEPPQGDSTESAPDAGH